MKSDQSPLNGCKVLVTRPEGLGENLGRLISMSSGVPVLLPTLEICAADGMKPRQLRDLMAESSCVIFISRNAVIYAHELLDNMDTLLEEKKVFAVGAATRRELTDKGVDNVRSPEQESGSESLLDMDDFIGSRISGRTILIVRGSSGRELLRDELQRRGAQVRYAGVYRTVIPDSGKEEMHKIWQTVRPDIIVVTSSQGLDNLLVITDERDKKLLYNSRLVVMSSRIGDRAALCGFVYPPAIAADQSDWGLFEAIVKTAGLLSDERRDEKT